MNGVLQGLLNNFFSLQAYQCILITSWGENDNCYRKLLMEGRGPETGEGQKEEWENVSVQGLGSEKMGSSRVGLPNVCL